MIDVSNLYSREVICIFPIEIPTPEGDIYAFTAIDVASTVAFEPLVEKNNGIDNLLNYIQQLVRDEKFLINKDQPFTLVLHKYEQYFPMIEQIIKPHKGVAVIVDEDLLLKTMTPFIENFYKMMGQTKQDAFPADLPDLPMEDMQFCFIDFVRVLPEQEDKGIKRFIGFAKETKNFRLTSDPKKLAEYLYKKLDPETTTGFQKTFLMFAELAPKNDIPKQYLKDQAAMLEGVNHILTLQNNDPNYPFADQLHPSRKNY